MLISQYLNNIDKYMPKSCDMCERGKLRAKSRSHSNIPTNRQQEVNLQNKTIDGKKYRLCTSCLRSMKKEVAK